MMRRVWVLAALALLSGCDDGAEATDGAGKTSPPIAANPVKSDVPAKSGESAQGQTDCSAEETTVFSCKLEGGKRLAICAYHGRDRRGAEYRFGPENAPELVLTGGTWASAAYSGGGEAQVAFVENDLRYTVFSRMVRTNFEPGEPNFPAISDGVIVERGGKVIAVKTCDDPETLAVQYDAAEEHLPRAEELFTDQTARADPH